MSNLQRPSGSDLPAVPLQIGNVIRASIRIYRDHFADYYKLAFISYLWILIPIYGWAKFLSISGLLSRLAYGQVSERPETINEARRHVNPRLWTFLIAAILVSLIAFAFLLGYGIIVGFIFFILGNIFQVSAENVSGIANGIFAILALLAILVLVVGIFWLSARLYLTEQVVAINEERVATKALNRSWRLTKEAVLRILGIAILAAVITLPISFAVQIVTYILQILLISIFPEDSAIYIFLLLIFSLLCSFAAGALLVPFWQTIKAVIFYHLQGSRQT